MLNWLWQSLVSRRRVRRRAQVGQARMLHLRRCWTRMDRARPTTVCPQGWFGKPVTSHSLARSAADLLERQPERTSFSLSALDAGYLLDSPRAVWYFPPEDEDDIATVGGFPYTDAGGRAKTPRSSSGGALRIRRDTLGAWP